MKKIFSFIIFFSVVFANAQHTTPNNFVGTPDSAVLKIKIFKFNQYNSVDTIVLDTSQKHIELFDNYTQDLVPVVNLGQIATPSLPLVFANRINFDGFIFLSPYKNYLLDPKSSFYFQNNNPFTDLTYLDGPKIREEQNLNAIHTQSFRNDSVNVGLRFNMMTAMNIADNKSNSSINKLSAWYARKFKNYNLFVSIYSNKIKRIENGGIIDTMPNFDPTNSLTFFLKEEPANIILYRGYYINHSYNLTKSIKARHIFQYSRISKTFIENNMNAFLGAPQLSNFQTYDSIGLRSFDNTFNLSIDKKNKIGISFTNRIQRAYYFRGYFYNLNGIFLTDNFLSGNIQNFAIGNLTLSALGNFHFIQRKAGDFDGKFELKYFFTDSLYFVFNQSFKKETPDYFLDYYNGNYQSWQNDFGDIISFTATARFISKKYHFEIGADYRQYTNYIYFDSLISPNQVNSTINVNTLWLHKSFYFGPFVTDLNGYWQQTNANYVLNIPEFVASGSFYLDVPLVKGALALNLGLNASFTSSFYAYAYSPSIGAYYQNFKTETGKYPVIDLFLTGKIKSAIIILRFDHANAWLLQNYYQTTEHYHLYHHYLRFGVRWWFKN
ncbi:MAG: hypothetical protein JXR68_12295 [Bacteroidales bacterium]|nr:hypothetical protein [Bacteroidales bacterium]